MGGVISFAHLTVGDVRSFPRNGERDLFALLFLSDLIGHYSYHISDRCKCTQEIWKLNIIPQRQKEYIQVLQWSTVRYMPPVSGLRCCVSSLHHKPGTQNRELIFVTDSDREIWRQIHAFRWTWSQPRVARIARWDLSHVTTNHCKLVVHFWRLWCCSSLHVNRSKMLFGRQSAVTYLLACKTGAISPCGSVTGCSSHSRCVSNVAQILELLVLWGYKLRPWKSRGASSLCMTRPSCHSFAQKKKQP